MTVKDLERLGVVLTPKLTYKSAAPLDAETVALLRSHKDELLRELIREREGISNGLVSRGLALYGDLLHSLMVWAARWSELRLEHPGGVILNAKPEHITDAQERYPWGVVYDQMRAVLITWGDVPDAALIGKRNLKTGALLAPEQEAA